MKYYYLIIFLFVLNLSTKGQNKNETVIYSFVTTKGEMVSLKLDTLNNVLICRLSSKEHGELEVIDDLKDEDVIFRYSYYFRGGGVINAGLDLNYLIFLNGNTKYTIYSEYSAEGDEFSTGIKRKDLDSGHVDDVEGRLNSIIGKLADFRYHEWVPIIEN